MNQLDSPPTANPHRHTKLAFVLACVFGAGLQPAFAQVADDSSTSASNRSRATLVEEIRVIGNPEDARSITGSAYVLDAVELEKFKLTNVNNILRSVPGVYVREEDGLGVFPRIGVRASSSGRSDRISLLEDGIPAAMAPYANTSAYYFPNMGRITGIEVLKGPEVLLHGPQTTAGVINLISTPIPSGSSTTVNVEVGSFETRKLHAHYGTTVGQWGFLLETYQGESDGFHELERSKHTAGYNINEYLGKARWESAAGARFTQQVDLKLHYDVERIDVSYLGQTDADFHADPNRRYGLSELERMDRGRRSASIRHLLGFDDNNSLEATAYWAQTYRYYNRLNQINGISLGGITNIINSDGPDADLLYGILRGAQDTAHANGVRYGHNHQRFTSQGVQLQSRNHIEWGGVAHELISGVRYSEEQPENAVKGLSNSIYQQVNGNLVHERTDSATPTAGEVEAFSFWIGDRIALGDVTLLPVLRHERIESKANIVSNPTPTQAAGRARNDLNNTNVGLGATYAVNERWMLLGGVHQGFAPPGNSAGQGTKGEESTNYEAGARFRNNGFGMDAVGFYSDFQTTLRQCLFANPCPSPVAGGAPIVDGSTQQTGAKEVYGLELSAFGDLYRNAAVTVPVRLSYTYTDGDYHGSSDLPTGVRDGDVIEYTPKHVASMQLGLAGTSGWSTYATLNFSDDAYTSNTAGRPGVDDRFLKTDSLFTMDLVASYPVNDSTELYLRLENLFDQQEITHRGADGARGNAPCWISFGFRMSL